MRQKKMKKSDSDTELTISFGGGGTDSGRRCHLAIWQWTLIPGTRGKLPAAELCITRRRATQVLLRYLQSTYLGPASNLMGALCVMSWDALCLSHVYSGPAISGTHSRYLLGTSMWR